MKKIMVSLIIILILSIGIFVGFTFIKNKNDNNDNNHEQSLVLKGYTCSTETITNNTTINDQQLSYQYTIKYQFNIIDNKLDISEVTLSEECLFANINDYNIFSQNIQNDPKMNIVKNEEKFIVNFNRYTIIGQKYEETKENYLIELKALGYNCVPNYDN